MILMADSILEQLVAGELEGTPMQQGIFSRLLGQVQSAYGQQPFMPNPLAAGGMSLKPDVMLQGLNRIMGIFGGKASAPRLEDMSYEEQIESVSNAIRKAAKEGNHSEVNRLLELYGPDGGKAILDPDTFGAIQEEVRKINAKGAGEAKIQQDKEESIAQTQQAQGELEAQEARRQQMAAAGAMQGYPEGSPGFSMLLGQTPGATRPSADVGELLRLLV